MATSDSSAAPPAGDEVIVVTGGCGFLGQNVVRKLLERGATDGKKPVKEIRVFDLGKKDFKDPRVKCVAGNLCYPEDVSKVVKGANAVIHCASANPMSKNKKLFQDVNVKGTQHIIDACLEHGVPKLVFTSTASVVYKGSDQPAGDESLPYAGKYRDVYAESKAEAEKLVLAANGRIGKTGKPLVTCALRPHGIFGEEDMLLVPSVVTQARKGKMKYMIGNGSNVVDFTYVGNVADAHLLALDALVPGGKVGGEAYFITNDEPIPFWTFMGRLTTGLGYEKPRIPIPYVLMYVIASIVDLVTFILSPVVTIQPVMTLSKVQIAGTHHYYSSAKAQRDFGYKPKVSVDEGIKRTLKFFSHLRNDAK